MASTGGGGGGASGVTGTSVVVGTTSVVDGGTATEELLTSAVTDSLVGAVWSPELQAASTSTGIINRTVRDRERRLRVVTGILPGRRSGEATRSRTWQHPNLGDRCCCACSAHRAQSIWVGSVPSQPSRSARTASGSRSASRAGWTTSPEAASSPATHHCSPWM